MLITFEDTLNKRDWLHSCLLNSLTFEAIESGEKTRTYEVKLLVNGIELEPTTLNTLLSNVEKFIDNEARNLAATKLQEIMSKASDYMDLIESAKSNLQDMIDIHIRHQTIIGVNDGERD